MFQNTRKKTQKVFLQAHANDETYLSLNPFRKK